MNVIKLEEVRKEDIEVAGGKGANLGELIQHGFPVPPGFVVVADTYRQFISDIAINTDSCQQIRKQILERDITAELQGALQRHHANITANYTGQFVYAVRSSATAEDLGDASFAGQHDTYYYVTSDQLPQMIKKCWASLWSDAAYSYRESQGIEHSCVYMAVVVQVMVESEISGVTFTANPLTGNTDEIVTESSWGMGAAIVDGRVSPDQYVFSKQNQRLISKRIADKKFMVPASVEGQDSRLTAVPALLRRKETLSQAQVKMLIGWAEKSEAYFGKPQDIEWAFRGDDFYILQSRPITTLDKHQEQIPAGEYVLFKPIAENFTDPLLPLSQDILIRLFPIVKLIQGRVYLNLAHLKPLIPYKIDSQTVAQLAYLSEVDEFKPRLSLIKLAVLGVLLYINYLVMGVFYHRTSKLPDDFMDSFRDLFNRVVADDKIDAPGAMEELFFKPRFFEPAGNMVFIVNLSAPRYIFILAALSRLLKWWLPDLREDAASYLTSGTEGILSTDMGRRIWYLSEQARLSSVVVSIIQNHEPKQALLLLRQEPEANNFMHQVDQFLAIHGHRTLKEFEINSVRWEEDPTPIIAMIRNYLQAEVDPTQSEQSVVAERRKFATEIKAGLEQKFLEKSFGLRWRIIEFLRHRAKYFIRLRENSRFFHIMAFYAVRKKVLKVEAALLEANKLKCKDDIYYLFWKEITALEKGEISWLDVEDRIRERRMEHIRLSKITPPKTFGLPSLQTDEISGDQIRGQGASPGEYEGIARVVMDPGTDAEIHPGEILIAPYTDPAWTPLFLTANAAVVEVGSYLSHAGTIAREYGMPCVVDAANCTERIQSGDRIRVNGSAGTVTLLTGNEEVATNA